MSSGLSEQGSPLRPLRAVDDVLASLRDEALDGAGTRRAVLQVADAVERSLRLLLRDHPGVPNTLRLRALAEDELSTGELLAELRQHGRISMELAASVHQLFEARQRLEQGSPPTAEDAAHAARVAEGVETEIAAAAPVDSESFASPPAAEPDGWPAPGTGPGPEISPAPEVRREPGSAVSPSTRASRPGRRVWAGGAAALVALLLAVLLLGPGDRRAAEMEQGIALFRSGAYPDAAVYFWRYAEANPEDPTPHLYLARIHRRMERFPLAADELEKAIALAPEDADVHGELGFLLLDTGRSEVAVERFRAALRLDPEGAGSWIGLVRALRVSGRTDAAERVLAQAPAEVRELFARRQPAPGS